MRPRAVFLLPMLAALPVASGYAPARAQEQPDMLRGTLPDTAVDQPSPRRRAAPQATDATLPVFALRNRSVTGPVVSSRVKGPKPQDIRPNPAVPGGGTGVAPGLALDPPRPRKTRPPEDPWQPLPHRVGNLNLLIANDLEAGHDDNTQRVGAGQPKRGSAFLREGGELRLQSDWSRHELTGDLSGGYSWYPNAPEANRPDLAGRLGLRLDMARDTQINLETRGKIDSQSPNSPDIASFSTTERALTYTYGASAGVTQHIDRLVLGLRGDVDRSTFDALKTSTGPVDQSGRNETAYGVTLRTGYELKPGLTPFFETTVDTRRYDHTYDDTGYQRSSNGVSGKLGTSFEITRTLTGSIAGGYGRREYDDVRLRTLRGPVADAAIIWAVTPLTTATLRGASSFDETTLVGSSGSIARRISLDINHQLLRNLALGAAIAFTDTRYQGIDRRDDVTTGTLKAEYRLNRTFSTRASYTYEHGLSTAPGQGYVSNIWMFGIKANL